MSNAGLFQLNEIYFCRSYAHPNYMDREITNTWGRCVSPVFIGLSCVFQTQTTLETIQAYHHMSPANV
jgi:hypothetical protein